MSYPSGKSSIYQQSDIYTGWKSGEGGYQKEGEVAENVGELSWIEKVISPSTARMNAIKARAEADIAKAGYDPAGDDDLLGDVFKLIKKLALLAVIVLVAYFIIRFRAWNYLISAVKG